MKRDKGIFRFINKIAGLKKSIQIPAMLFLCAVLAVPLITVNRPGIEPFDVTGLSFSQKDFVITASWDNDPKCVDYTVFVTKKGSLKRHMETVKKNSFRIKDVFPKEEYKVTVLGRRVGQGMSEAATEHVTAHKEYQRMDTKKDIRQGFADDTTSVKTKAEGKVSYETLTPDTASVDAKGNVTFLKTGDAEILITAKGTDLYKKTEKTVKMKVYPENLDKAENLRVTKKTGSDAVFEWDKVDYAAKYSLYKKNGATGKYEKVKGSETEKTKVKVLGVGGDYKVKAPNEINGKEIKSDLSEEEHLTPVSESASSHKSITVRGNIGSDNVKRIASVTTGGYAPQSMCVTDDGYVIAFSYGAGSGSGKLKKYSFDGKEKKSVNASNVGHCNGCTYNPENDSILLMKSYSKKRTKKVAVFDAETLSRRNDITMKNNFSGGAYDEYSRSFCLSAGDKFLVTNSNLVTEKKIHKKQSQVSQDMGAYNGVALCCIWKGATSYIDMYRLSDSAYIGSYAVRLGEIESVAVKDGKFVILVNNGNDDALYITKEKIDFS